MCEHGSFVVEIQSVNRRFVEMNLALPRQFMRFETLLRKKINASVGRGMLQVVVSWKMDQKQSLSLAPNLPLARAIKSAWEELASDLWIENKVPLDLLIQQKDLFISQEDLEDAEVYETPLEEAVAQALEALDSMKKVEGAALAQDLSKRIEVLLETIDQIESLATGLSDKLYEKLSERLKELFEESVANEERVLREVAVFAEKVDVTEEIVRFKSHLQQFSDLLKKSSADAVETRGKTFDFLVQELLREINTVGSKGADAVLTQKVVSIKAELEKMREQIQNIE